MTYQTILDYWFGDLKNNDFFPARKAKIWYRKDKKVDDYITQNFTEIWNLACHRKLSSWCNEIRGSLALIIVLDQFSRHICRGNSNSYMQDSYSLDLCLRTINFDITPLFTVEKAFLYMPLQHSENLQMQQKSVCLYKELVDEAHEKIREQMYAFYDYACAHRDIIKRFGRFPHRNAILQRPSTKEERQFLERSTTKF